MSTVDHKQVLSAISGMLRNMSTARLVKEMPGDRALTYCADVLDQMLPEFELMIQAFHLGGEKAVEEMAADDRVIEGVARRMPRP